MRRPYLILVVGFIATWAAAAAPFDRFIVRRDIYGDRLPARAAARFGTVRFRGILARAPDSASLATLRDNCAAIIDATTGAELRRIPGPDPRQFEAWSLLFSPNGKLVAYGGASLVEVWDVTAGQRLHVLKSEQSDPVYMEFGRHRPCAFTNDGALITEAVAGQARLVCWELGTGRQRWQFIAQDVNGNFEQPAALGLIPDEAAFAIIQHKQNEASVSIVSLIDGQVMRTYSMGQSPSVRSALSPDGLRLVYADSTGKIHRMDLRNGTQLPAMKAEFNTGVEAMVFSPDNNRVAVIQFGDVAIIDFATGKVLGRTRSMNYVGYAEAHALFSADGKSLWLTHADSPNWKKFDGVTGAERKLPASVRGGPIHCLATTPDGTVVATTDREDAIRLWNVATARSTRRLLSEPFSIFNIVPSFDSINAVAFSPDGSQLAGASSDGRVLIWEHAAGRIRKTLRVPGDLAAQSVKWSLNGDCIIIGQDSNNNGDPSWIRIFDVATGKERLKFMGPTSGVDQAEFSPDGRLIFGMSRYQDDEDSLVVLDVATGQRRMSLNASVSAATFMPHGATLAYSADGEFVLWEIATGQARLRLPHPDGEALDCMAVSPDGRWLAGINSGAGTRRIYLWDVRTGAALEPLIGHDNHVTALAFAENGRLFSASTDTTVLVWDIPTQQSVGQPISTDRFKSLWADLAGDADVAHRAMETLVACGAAAVEHLKFVLSKAGPVDRVRLEEALRQLDAPQYADRRRGVSELEALDLQAEPALRRQVDSGASAEARRSARRLLDRLSSTAGNVDRLRELRAIEVLERIGTNEVRSLLVELTAGDPAARLTQAAKGAFERHDRRVSKSVRKD